MSAPTPAEIQVYATAAAGGSIVLSFTRTDIPYTTVGPTKSVDELIESVEHYFLWVQARFNVQCIYNRKRLKRVWQSVQPTPIYHPTVSYEYVDPFRNVTVDLTEALVGWKCWNVDQQHLKTQGETLWTPDKPLEARCTVTNLRSTHFAPWPSCNCGVHGASDQSTAKGYGEIMGEVYGWGRYVRNDGGWRAQFAYPKSFLLQREQANVIEWLRNYHVPIFIIEPSLIYNPEEDGYEYRQTEAYWDKRAGEDTTAGEDNEADDYDDY